MMKKSQLKPILMGALLMGAASPALAYEEGTWIIRGGLSNVAPDDSSSNVFVDGADLGVGVNVDSNVQIGLNLVYFIQDNIALEVLAATPFSHDIGLNTVGALGSTKHLPPTVSVNYHFAEPSAAFQPYVGAGVNYTVFFDEEFTSANADAGFSDLDLDDSFGLALQVGFDYMINDRWLFNASARWIDIDTDATFDLNGDAGQVSVDIDPMVYTISLGYRF
jgi:outer membrane protein